MKVTLQQIEKGNEEVIIRYRRMTERMERIIEYLEGQSEKLSGTKGGQEFFISIQDILYLESVDGVTYFYTKKEVYRVSMPISSDKNFLNFSIMLPPSNDFSIPPHNAWRLRYALRYPLSRRYVSPAYFLTAQGRMCRLSVEGLFFGEKSYIKESGTQRL